MNKLGKLALSVVMAGSVLFAGGNASEAANNKASDDLIIINKATNQLAFYEDGKRVIINTVATGKNEKTSKTPEGKFKVVNKVKERKWNKENIPGGDPRNPLGARWIGFSVVDAKGIKNSWGAKTGNSYGIHGHAKGAEWSIGKKVTNGCIRMRNASVISLFNRVHNGTMVKIYNRESTSFDKVALDMGFIKAKDAEIKTKAKIVKWKGNIVRIEYGKNKTRKNLTTSNKWYQKNLKKGKTYTFYHKGNKVIKVNS